MHLSTKDLIEFHTNSSILYLILRRRFNCQNWFLPSVNNDQKINIDYSVFNLIPTILLRQDQMWTCFQDTITHTFAKVRHAYKKLNSSCIPGMHSVLHFLSCINISCNALWRKTAIFPVAATRKGFTTQAQLQIAVESCRQNFLLDKQRFTLTQISAHMRAPIELQQTDRVCVNY